MNNKKKVFLGIAGVGLLGLVGAGVGLLNNVNAVETKAAAGDDYFYRGTLNSWGNGTDAFKIIDGDEPLILNCAAGDEFKVTPDASNWAGEINTATGDAISSGAITASGGTSNIYVNRAGKYAFSIVNGALFLDYAEYKYIGSDCGDPTWFIVEDSDHPKVELNEGPSVFNLTEGEKFKLINPDSNWSYGVFGYSILEDGDFYGSFSADNDGNIVCEITGAYDVSVDMNNHGWTVRIVPNGVDPDETAYVYVLDKYGNALNSNHYAHTFNAAGQKMGWPGATMETYAGTTHMYQQEFWVGMEKIIFNNGTTQSWSYDISGVYSNAGKCLILDGSTTHNDIEDRDEWSSNVWVAPQTAKFIENYMHFQNFNEEDRTEGTACKGESGYYKLAKEAYQNASFADYRAELCTLDYVVERLQAWAEANEEEFVVSAGVGAFSSARVGGSVIDSANSNNNFAAAFAIIGGVVVIASGAFILLKRKKEN